MQGDRPMVGMARVALMVLAAGLILFGFWRSLPGDGLLDYGSFVASGRAAAEGLNPYGIYPLTFHVVLPGFESWNPNLNPPISALVFQVFDMVDPHLGFRIWWAVSIACYALTVALLVRRYARQDWLLVSLWAFALAGFWDTLVLGQIYMPLVLAGVGAWLLLERRSDLAAGVLMGVVIAMKPNFLVWPALLFLAGYWRSSLAAVGAAAVFSLLPVLVYGPVVYVQWLELVASDGARAVFLTNASLAGLAARIGVPEAGNIVSLFLLAGLALWAWRGRPGPLRASAVGLAGALLASPVAWVHYTLFLLPVLIIMRGSWLIRGAALLLAVPVTVVLDFAGAPAWQQVTVGSLYGWAVVLCLIAVLKPVLPVAARRAVRTRTGPVAGRVSVP